jgi:DNA modification methylase
MEATVVNQACGEAWALYNADSVTAMPGLPDESVDLSIHSPPFSSLYTFSNSERDLGNSRDDGEFFEHYRYVIRELLRVTKPGRLAAVHCQQLMTSKATHGVMGLKDFRGDIIRAYLAEGWVFHAEICCDKDPQSVACRTKKTSLLFATLRRDRAVLSPVFADYVCVFRKPGENREPIKDADVSSEDWILWARPIWYDIEETRVLNVQAAREDEDSRHLCPMSLDTIERCVRLWSNKGETVFDPFAGIGSTLYQSILLGRRAVGIELKGSYFLTAVANLNEAERQAHEPTLFDDLEETSGFVTEGSERGE